jgi:DNA-binding transcriptional regulator GbsR (MarR family)
LNRILRFQNSINDQPFPSIWGNQVYIRAAAPQYPNHYENGVLLSEHRKQMYEAKPIPLSSAQQKLIESWGRLAYAWGVGPTMAQIFALLYVWPEPLDSDTILVTLQISRGNVSINLRKLLEWGLIKKIDLPNSRKSLYTAERDIWTIAANIIRARFAREIAPIQQLLEEFRQDPSLEADPHFRQSLSEIQTVVTLLSEVVALALPALTSPERERLFKVISAWQRRQRDGNSL